MKKFAFSLAAVEKYKKTVEKKQKSELAAANARLRALNDEKNAIDAALDDLADSQLRALKESLDLVFDLSAHHAYFVVLRDNLSAVVEKIVLAQAERDKIQTALIATMKELKTLEKLRKEEYAAYLEEVRKDEEKSINDLISFYSITAEETNF